jgi:membrane associated rhomboid family serine protease
VLYPRARVHVLFIFIIFVQVIVIPAYLVLLWWIALQLLSGLPQLGPAADKVAGGVAFWAHIGGFVAGVVLIKLFVNDELHAARAALDRRHGFVGRRPRYW